MSAIKSMNAVNNTETRQPMPPAVMGWLDCMVRRCHIHRWKSIIGGRSDRTDWGCWLRSCRCGKLQYRSLREPTALSKWYDLDDAKGPAQEWEIPEILKSAQYEGLIASNAGGQRP